MKLMLLLRFLVVIAIGDVVSGGGGGLIKVFRKLVKGSSKASSSQDASNINKASSSRDGVNIKKSWKDDLPKTKLSFQLIAEPADREAMVQLGRNEKSESKKIIAKIPWLGDLSSWKHPGGACPVSLLDPGNGAEESNIVLTTWTCAYFKKDKAIIRFPGDLPFFVDKMKHIYGRNGARTGRHGSVVGDAVPILSVVKMTRARKLGKLRNRLRLPMSDISYRQVTASAAWWTPMEGQDGMRMPAMQIHRKAALRQYLPQEGRFNVGLSTIRRGSSSTNTSFHGPLGSAFYEQAYRDKEAILIAIKGSMGDDPGQFYSLGVDFVDEINQAIAGMSG